MKYIVTKTSEGIEEIFMFPRAIDHNVFANSVRHLKQGSGIHWECIERKPIAAGFINHEMNCYGCSTSLSLVSRLKTDTDLLVAQTYFY